MTTAYLIPVIVALGILGFLAAEAVSRLRPPDQYQRRRLQARRTLDRLQGVDALCINRGNHRFEVVDTGAVGCVDAGLLLETDGVRYWLTADRSGTLVLLPERGRLFRTGRIPVDSITPL